MPGTFVSRAVLALGAALAALVLSCSAAQAQDPCEDPRNLTFNCQFDTFSPAPGGEVPTGWWPFVVSGHPAFDTATDTPKLPSLRVWSDGEGFVAGIYQEVSGIEVGATYEAFIGWAVFMSAGSEMGRAIGIDPTGGTDPTAGTVVWSPEVWEKKRTNPELRVRAVAQADRITVFVRANNPRSSGADQAFLDAVCLMRDETVAVAPVAAPEPTAAPIAPPPDTPTPASPEPEQTSTSTPTATPEPTETQSTRSTETPSPEPSAETAETVAPTHTATPLPPTATAARSDPEVWVLASAPVTLESTPVFAGVVAPAQASIWQAGSAVWVVAALAGGALAGLIGVAGRRGGRR